MKTALNRIVNFILPPRCIGTGEIVEKSGLISAEFWQKLHFIEHPYCAECGIPFEISITNDQENLDTIACTACLAEPHIFDKARSSLIYETHSRSMILSFKYGDKLHAVDSFALWLKKSARDFIDDGDMILPVPLHAHRLWWRRFNQSALLAEALSKKTGLPHYADILIRKKKTRQHKNMSDKQRTDNVRGAFDLRHISNKERIQGKNIILIDDVFTTGATLNACAKTLKRHGANKIYALTLARVLL